MQIITIKPTEFGANCYLLTVDGKHAIAIDPAQPRILTEAEKRGLTVTHVLLTHGHFDHIGGCAALQAAGAKIGCLEREKIVALGPMNMGDYFHQPVPSFSIDFTFEDGDTLELDGMQFTVMNTPGHTAGSCCFLIGDDLFSGDTLFQGTHGRTDPPTGGEADMWESLKKLSMLKNHTVYPGHGMHTTLDEERKYGVLRM